MVPRRYQENEAYEQQDGDRIPQDQNLILSLITRPLIHAMTPRRLIGRISSRWSRRYQENDEEYEQQDDDRIPQEEAVRSSYRMYSKYGDGRVPRRFQETDEEYEQQDDDRIPQQEAVRRSYRSYRRYGDAMVPRRYQGDDSSQ
jgi:hypothetical protein